MQNKLLFLFDLLVLPVTLIRILLIYLYGSRYGIANMDFLDILMHAKNKYFNQQEDDISIDVVSANVKISINECSRLDKIEKHIMVKQIIPEVIDDLNVPIKSPKVQELILESPPKLQIIEQPLPIILETPVKETQKLEPILEDNDETIDENDDKEKLKQIIDSLTSHNESSKNIDINDIEKLNTVLKENIDQVIEEEISKISDLMSDSEL